MGWNDEEIEKEKKGMNTSSKILLAIIACVILIIILIIMLLMNTQTNDFQILADGKSILNVNKETLVTNLDGTTYLNIEELANIVGYEYHRGEYKSSIIEDDKCYVEGEEETTSFYLNDNKIYKLPINTENTQYQEHILSNPTRKINGAIYASIEAISKAFNVLIDYKNEQLKIYTLEYLVTLYESNLKEWGFESIKDQSLENQKALLYGYLIVKKDGGLYKVIDSDNTKEITLDRYTAIEFNENTQEFFVTDSFKNVGIVNLDGTSKIEPAYDSISVLSKEHGLYLVEHDKKYGVVSNNGRSVIYPEYDSIGLTNDNAENKYLLLNELIPVCKNDKWGAFNINGKLVFDVEYDEFGYNLNSIEINGIKKVVQPVITITRANGVVVKKENKYGLLDVNGSELVPIAVDGIYIINGIEDEDERYFMLYNGEEMNIIERLIIAGKIEKNLNKEENENPSNNNQNIIENTVTNNIDNIYGNNTDVKK